MAVTIKIDGVNELVSKIENMQKFNRVKAIIRQGGVYLQGKLRDYPPQAHIPNPLISSNDRVRRGFFYHLNKGDISVPYGRRVRLAKGWSVKKGPHELSVIVGNSVKYAPLVQGADTQTYAHQKAGWLTEAGAVEEHGDYVTDIIRRAIEEEVAI